jgi:DNA-binding transcriptional ArsR family regulator
LQSIAGVEVVRDRVEMWAMAHPIRFRIFELLREGPSTASRLGRRLGESSGTASYHLRFLARAGAIHEAPELGNKRERWWRRPDNISLVPTDNDLEGRAITTRMFALFFARDAETRRRFVAAMPELSREWHEGAFVGNWQVKLTPTEASELGARLLPMIDEFRRRAEPPEDAAETLVSFSVLPWLEEEEPGPPGGAPAS